LRGEDLLVPTGRKGKRGMVSYALRFHLGPGIEIGLSQDKQGVGMALPDGSYWQFRSGGAKSPSRNRSGPMGRGGLCRCSNW
jgi:uncharacterized heparinase superfamily protein